MEHRLDPRRLLCVAALLTLTGCDVDADLLTTADEKALGTDPSLADTDGDGLSDGLEQLLYQTDPTRADTDGDGDDDGWEVQVGLDPLDASSRRYEAGWPHLDQGTKEELQRSEAPSLVEVGKRVRNFKLLDHNAQRVELYDFARAGAPTVVAHSGSNVLAALLEWLQFDTSYPFEEAPYEADLKTAILDGALRLVVVPSEGFGERGEAIVEQIQELLITYDTTPQVAVFVDDGYAFWGHLNRPFVDADPGERRANAFRMVLLDEDMIVRAIDDWQAAVDALQP